MENVSINTDFIKLDQFLKWTDFVSTGADAKALIFDGKVRVNGEVEMRRGRKLIKGDIIEVGNRVLKIQ